MLRRKSALIPKARRSDTGSDDSWDEARRHPTLTVVRLFVAGFVGAALISYLGRGATLYASLAIGLGCGLVLARLGRRVMRDGVDSVTRSLRPLTVVNVLSAGVGLVLLGWGTITFDWPLALSGLPLLTLAVVLTVMRLLVSRR